MFASKNNEKYMQGSDIIFLLKSMQLDEAFFSHEAKDTLIMTLYLWQNPVCCINLKLSRSSHYR